jgi:hypothetical protein
MMLSVRLLVRLLARAAEALARAVLAALAAVVAAATAALAAVAAVAAAVAAVVAALLDEVLPDAPFGLLLGLSVPAHVTNESIAAGANLSSQTRAEEEEVVHVKRVIRSKCLPALCARAPPVLGLPKLSVGK